jgi:hypothetical protein
LRLRYVPQPWPSVSHQASAACRPRILNAPLLNRDKHPTHLSCTPPIRRRKGSVQATSLCLTDPVPDNRVSRGRIVHNGWRRPPRSPHLPLHGHWPGRVNVVLGTSELSEAYLGGEADLIRHRSFTGQRKTVLPTHPTSRSMDQKQLTQPHRACPPRLEASLGPLKTKSKGIGCGELLLGEHCTYYHQYDALSRSFTQRCCLFSYNNALADSAVDLNVETL